MIVLLIMIGLVLLVAYWTWADWWTMRRFRRVDSPFAHPLDSPEFHAALKRRTKGVMDDRS